MEVRATCDRLKNRQELIEYVIRRIYISLESLGTRTRTFGKVLC